MKHLGADIPRPNSDLNEKAIPSPCLHCMLQTFEKPPKDAELSAARQNQNGGYRMHDGRWRVEGGRS